ncbi:MAG TPA: hypothetical protein VGQ11_13215, partial [Candidatus Acidoferrales bacterium]|nr:hypothetical protein [Candidatus Acidoferrales bacterium]
MTPAKQFAVLAAVLCAGALVAAALLTGRAVWLALIPAIALLFWALRSPYRCLLLVLVSFPLE